MSSVITSKGQTRINQLKGDESPLIIDRMVLALIPGLDPSQPVNRNQQMPPSHLIVHTYDIPTDYKGYVAPDQVVYSMILDSDVGNFDFNWIGTQEADTRIIITVTTTPVTPKRKTNLATNTTGNNVTRNVMLRFLGAKTLTGVTINAQTWQFDYQAVLQSHTKNKSNPHAVTKTQVGLGNIPNAKSDSVSSSSMNQLATSKAVKKAFDKAVAAQSTADAALPKTGGTVSELTTFSKGISIEGAPLYSMKDSNSDYLWHDHSKNEWHFCSDAGESSGATGNSTLCAGALRFANGKALLGASDDDGIHLQNDNGYVHFSPDSAVSCRFSTDRNKFYFDKPLYVKGEIYAGSSYDSRVYHKGYKPTKADVGLGNLPNVKSDSITTLSSNQLATSKAVKKIHDAVNAVSDRVKLATKINDFKALKLANGYQVLPSGIIIQWGFFNRAVHGEYKVTYPMSFRHDTLQVITTTPSADQKYGHTSVTSKTRSSFSGDKGTGAGMRWIAIGY